MSAALLGPGEIRALAGHLGLRPTKTLGQNFVHDANTIRRIVRAARLRPGEQVLEIGPGLGSLTLGLLAAGYPVTAVEVDPTLAAALPDTVQARIAEPPLKVVEADAARVTELPGPAPTALVANLPYNVAVPVLLHLFATFESLEHGLVLVQAEVADRLTAGPGTRIYGVPSVKLAWFAAASRAGAVSRNVFWPVPNVDSELVRLRRRDPPPTSATREDVFGLIDTAFAQRRKMLRAALRDLDVPEQVSRILERAGIDPAARGETLDVAAFAHLAESLAAPQP
jgi:16S rRNA (adenine1518-N6/adenine1519-N6)-dimethyltransferase